MISTQSLLQFVILAIAIFLVCGGPALINMLIHEVVLNEPYPKMLALSPIAMFLTILGFTGLFLVILCPRNMRNGNVKLAKKQFWVGFTLLFLAYTCLNFLWNYGITS